MEKLKLLRSEKIEIHNADGLCGEKSCNKKPTYMVTLEILGKTFYLFVCKEHRKIITIYEENKWRENLR